MCTKNNKYFLTLKIKYLLSYFIWLMLYIFWCYLIKYILELDQMHVKLFSVISSTYPALSHIFDQDTITLSN